MLVAVLKELPFEEACVFWCPRTSDFSPTAFNCCIACSRLFFAVSSIIVPTLTLSYSQLMLKEHHGVWRLHHLVTHLKLPNLLLLSSHPLKYPPRSLPKNPWTSTTSPSSVFLLSRSFKCAKCTDFLISLVTGIFAGIFSDLQFTGSWNFTASFRSHKPTIVCSQSLDLYFLATLAFIKRLRLESAFPGPKQGMT